MLWSDFSRLKLFWGFVALSFLAACSGGNDAAVAEAKPPVVTEILRLQDVNVHEDYAGRARGAREVQVRARIQGILEERLYIEGQSVQEGDVLFRIDPEPAEARLQGARAVRQQAQAELQQAQREWKRVRSLFERNVASERERDAAQSALEMAEANLSVAEANVVQAELERSYTLVKAPVSGITSLEDLPEGSLVDQGTLLTTIVQQDPIHVHFSLPEGDRVRQQAAAKQEGAATLVEELDVSLMLSDGRRYTEPGYIDFTASTLDPRTGSLSARAVFPNPDGALVPGQFVRVRLVLATFKQALTVPEKALVTTPRGLAVFVVDEQQQARQLPVEAGPVVSGRRLILSGLQAGQQVITSGQVALSDGRSVAVVSTVEP